MHTYPQVHTQIRYTWIGEGNGNPLQYSCLGNPMERGAWWDTEKKKKKEPIDIKGHPCGCRSKSACLTETGQAQSTEMHSTHPHGSRCSPANTVFLCWQDTYRYLETVSLLPWRTSKDSRFEWDKSQTPKLDIYGPLTMPMVSTVLQQHTEWGSPFSEHTGLVLTSMRSSVLLPQALSSHPFYPAIPGF